MELFTSSNKSWIKVVENEIQVELVVFNDFIKEAAIQALSKICTKDKLDNHRQYLNVSPFSIQYFTAFIVKGNNEPAKGVNHYDSIQPNAMHAVTRFSCENIETANNVTNKLKNGDYDIMIFLHFNQFKEMKQNPTIVTINQLKSVARKTIADAGDPSSKFIHRNQLLHFVDAYLKNANSIIFMKDLTSNWSSTIDNLRQQSIAMCQLAFVEIQAEKLKADDYQLLWKNVDFDPERLQTEINQVFKTNRTHYMRIYSDAKQFKIDQEVVARLAADGSSILQPLWNSLKNLNEVTNQTKYLSISNIENRIRSQLMSVTWQQKQFTPENIDVIEIIHVVERMQEAIINFLFLSEKQTAHAIRTISINHQFIDEKDSTGSRACNCEHSSILMSVPAIIENTEVSKTSTIVNLTDLPQVTIKAPITIKQPLTNTSVLIGHDAIFRLQCNADSTLVIKWFFNKKQLEQSSKYEIQSTGENQTLTIYNTSIEDMGRFHALIDNGIEVQNQYANLIVKMKPVIVGADTVKHEIVLAGKDIELSWKFDGIEKPKIYWFFNDKPLIESSRHNLIETEDDESILLIQQTKINDMGIYTIRVNNSVGEAIARTNLSIITNRTVLINDLEFRRSVIRGQTVDLILNISAGPGTKVIWMQDNTIINSKERMLISSSRYENVEEHKLTIADFSVDDQAQYWARIENIMQIFRSRKCQLSISAIPNISSDAKWESDGVTVISNITEPKGITINPSNGIVYAADSINQRIVSCKATERIGRLVARNNGYRHWDDPSDLLFDRETSSIIVSDTGNRRVLRWSLYASITQGETIIDNIDCWGLAMDNEGALYVSDYKKHEVRRFKKGMKIGMVVAGGNADGNRLDQLNHPTYIALDSQGSIYISDTLNSRVVKWTKNAKNGTLSADCINSQEKKQLFQPYGIVVDADENIYVVDSSKSRVMRKRKDEQKFNTLLRFDLLKNETKQLSSAHDLSFDHQNNLYVADTKNNRIQRFSSIK